MTKNQEYLAKAIHGARWSDDSDTQVGCVIAATNGNVIVGWNEFPIGVNNFPNERRTRPTKYKWIQHAEANVICTCAQFGVPTDKATMYLPWFPCTTCAQSIITAGIAELVCYQPDLDNPKWGEDFKIALTMLTEAGVKITYEVP